MPCNDVTELVSVVVDAADRLKAYELTKRSCGQAVGAGSLIADHVLGLSVDAIFDIGPEEFSDAYPADSGIEEFLALKHLFAVQSALAVLTGRDSGGPDDLCSAAEIYFEDGDTELRAQLKVDLITEKIKSCGGCKSCGKKAVSATGA